MNGDTSNGTDRLLLCANLMSLPINMHLILVYMKNMTDMSVNLYHITVYFKQIRSYSLLTNIGWQETCLTPNNVGGIQVSVYPTYL